ncbi:hypothetical protein MKEN_00908300 [Mycena kentingensis (nom. inval.)]|nr:hypothetical protein MKEN_00908300 [Mycena kentingensis (nom. inval.)]
MSDEILEQVLQLKALLQSTSRVECAEEARAQAEICERKRAKMQGLEDDVREMLQQIAKERSTKNTAENISSSALDTIKDAVQAMQEAQTAQILDFIQTSAALQEEQHNQVLEEIERLRR